MSRTPLFRGAAPALVTPFDADGAIDEAAFRRLVDAQIEGGVDAVVVLGTTGENPTIDDDERRRLVDLTIEHVAGRVPVVVGTGTNNTRQSARYSREAADAGADGLLVVGPYYNKPTPDGYLAHFAAVAEATDCPMIVYNVPGRTGSNITANTFLRVAEQVPSVVGVKEASGDVAQISDVLAGRPEGVAVYAGDDELTLPLLVLGADGVVSVVVNAAPRLFSELVRKGLEGDYAGARELHFQLLPAMRACFYESNPAPIKAVLADRGLIGDHFRLPMRPVSDATRARVLDAFRDVKG